LQLHNDETKKREAAVTGQTELAPAGEAHCYCNQVKLLYVWWSLHEAATDICLALQSVVPVLQMTRACQQQQGITSTASLLAAVCTYAI
jgi:hypothetical protein